MVAMTTITTTSSASERIAAEVTTWPGIVPAVDERFGHLSFQLGRREIGHLHGDHAAHFSFPKAIGLQLREEGRVGPHPVFPDKPAMASRRIEGDGDVRAVIELLRMNYDRIVARYGLPDGT